MEILTSKDLNEKLLRKQLSSGLNCYIMPKEGYTEKQAMLAVKYGSSDAGYVDDGKVTVIPKGTAHYLEHKMFDNPHGSAFDDFSKNGAYVNAYTSFNITAYYFSCSNNFNENLKLLLDCVSTPYFTKHGIEKERGIISQEIKMYDDNPGWKVFFNLLNGLYHSHPAKDSIAGSDESIAQIDKKVLQSCYDRFYHPANCMLICAGDIDPDEVFRLAAGYFNGRPDFSLNPLGISEPEEIKTAYVSEKMPVFRPLFHIGFKDTVSFDQSQNVTLNKIAGYKILWDLLIGESALFREKLQNLDLIDDKFAFEYITGPGYGYCVLTGESANPKRLLEQVIAQGHKIMAQGISNADFVCLKRKHTGRFIRGLNSIESIISAQADFITKGLDLFSLYNMYQNITLEDIEALLHECFESNRTVLSVIEPS